MSKQRILKKFASYASLYDLVLFPRANGPFPETEIVKYNRFNDGSISQPVMKFRPPHIIGKAIRWCRIYERKMKQAGVPLQRGKPYFRIVAHPDASPNSRLVYLSSGLEKKHL